MSFTASSAVARCSMTSRFRAALGRDLSSESASTSWHTRGAKESADFIGGCGGVFYDVVQYASHQDINVLNPSNICKQEAHFHQMVDIRFRARPFSPLRTVPCSYEVESSEQVGKHNVPQDAQLSAGVRCDRRRGYRHSLRSPTVRHQTPAGALPARRHGPNRVRSLLPTAPAGTNHLDTSNMWGSRWCSRHTLRLPKWYRYLDHEKYKLSLR